MKKRLLSLIFLMNILVGISGQDYVDKIIHVWGGMFYDQSPLIIDQSGNIYLTGMFLDTIFFGSKDNYLVPVDSVDSFMTKINPDGTPAWTKVLSGLGHEYILDIAVNEEGFIYLIGDFSGTMMIDTAYMETDLGSDSYICKLDPGGNMVELVRNSEDGELLYFSSIELDADGQIYLLLYL